VFSGIVLHRLDIREHLGQLPTGNVRSQLQSPHLVRGHILRAVHRALADRLEIGQQSFGLDLLT